jgi:hypothetical protein
MTEHDWTVPERNALARPTAPNEMAQGGALVRRLARSHAVPACVLRTRLSRGLQRAGGGAPKVPPPHDLGLHEAQCECAVVRDLHAHVERLAGP